MGRAERSQVSTQPHEETTGVQSPNVGGKEGILKRMVFYLRSEDENSSPGTGGAGEERDSMSQGAETECYIKAWF